MRIELDVVEPIRTTDSAKIVEERLQLSQVSLSQRGRIHEDILVPFQPLEHRHALKGKRKLIACQDVEEDHLVITVPQMLHPSLDVRQVIEHVGDDDDQSSLLDATRELMEDASEYERNSILRDKEKYLKKAAMLGQELNPAMREFCEAMLWCDTATAAAIHAGYSEQTARQKASKLMADPRITDYIEALQACREITSALDDQSIIRMQLTVYQKALEDNDLKACNTAVDQLAKMMGTYNKAKAKPEGNSGGGKGKMDNEEQAEMFDLVQKIAERKA